MAEAITTSADNTTATRPRIACESTHPPQDVQWLFIVIVDQPVLYSLQLQNSQTGATIMHILDKEYRATKPVLHWYHTRLQLEDAIISPFCVGNPEAQDYPRKVIIKSSTPCPDLTEAFHNPTVLRGTDFLRLHEQFNISPSAALNDHPRHAILIKTEVSKYILGGVVAGVVLFSTVVGIVVWYFSRNAGLGLAASGGAVSIFSLIQAYLSGMKLLGEGKGH